MALDQLHHPAVAPRLEQGREEHSRETLNGVCCAAPILLSIMALTLVGQGVLQYGLHPPVGEGMHAFLFQLLMVVQLPLIAIFVATADWSTRIRSGAILGTQVLAWFVAFGAVYAWEVLASSAM